MPTMLGINVGMKYIDGAFTYFIHQVEDDIVASLSCLHEGGAKVWYVCSPCRIKEFEQFSSKILFHLNYISDYKDKER